MNTRWRPLTNAVLSVVVLAGMVALPSFGDNGAANAQVRGENIAVGDQKSESKERGDDPRTSKKVETVYEASTGVTTARKLQTTYRLYSERTLEYQQTDSKTETRYKQEPVYETRYRDEERTRQEVQQVARTGTRTETRMETRHRPVYRTEYRDEQEAYDATGWRWETRYRSEWQWITRSRTVSVLRWYTSPGYWETYSSYELLYPGCYYGYIDRERWVDGTSYSRYEDETESYQSCELVSVPYEENVEYTYTAYRTVQRAYQVQVEDLVGYTAVYGWTWVPETYESYELLYPGCYYGYTTRTKEEYRYCFLRNDPVYEPRTEAYEVPVEVTVEYTYYEPVTVTVTYYVQIPYEVQVDTRTVAYDVVIPVYGWVPITDWLDKEEVKGTRWLVVGQTVTALSVADAASPTKARSSTFLSDRGGGTTATALAGSKQRTAFKADEALASKAKKHERDTGASTVGNATGNQKGKGDDDKDKDNRGGNGGGKDDDNDKAFAITDWAGTYEQGNLRVVVTVVSVADRQLPLFATFRKNGKSWDPVAQDVGPSGSFEDKNLEKYEDKLGPNFYGKAELKREKGKLYLKGKFEGRLFPGGKFEFDNNDGLPKIE